MGILYCKHIYRINELTFTPHNSDLSESIGTLITASTNDSWSAAALASDRVTSTTIRPHQVAVTVIAGIRCIRLVVVFLENV